VTEDGGGGRRKAGRTEMRREEGKERDAEREDMYRAA